MFAVSEQFREILLGVGIATIMIGTALRFRTVSKRPEFKDLMDSGQKVNLNLLTLIAGFARLETDPLRKPHEKIARIGFKYFFRMLAGIVCYGVAVAAIFRVAPA
ncbi:MAG: hypothetical protein H6842_00480 [Rhodospirillaceae bacterium]|nr:hypothetical protein [Rhodospirillaceae bacterium]